jgi:hypothetical protein
MARSPGHWQPWPSAILGPVLTYKHRHCFTISYNGYASVLRYPSLRAFAFGSAFAKSDREDEYYSPWP